MSDWTQISSKSKETNLRQDGKNLRHPRSYQSKFQAWLLIVGKKKENQNIRNCANVIQKLYDIQDYNIKRQRSISNKFYLKEQRNFLRIHSF